MAHATWSRQAGYAASPSNLSTRRSTSALSSAELNEARQVTQYEYVIHIRCDDTIPTIINYSLQLVMSWRALTKSVANLSIKEKAMNLSSFTIVATFVVATLISVQTAIAQTADQLRRDAHAALNSLYAKNPGAKEIGKKAVAVLVFPGILKAGLGFGGQYGEGVLFKGGKAVGYYNTAGASYGLQAGGQKYGYALFYLSNETLKTLDQANGFEVGVGPSVVVADEGMGRSMTTTTTQDKIYAFIFDQKGAMAALGLQGNKITKIEK